MKRTVLNGKIIAPLLIAVLFILLGIGSLFVEDSDIVAMVAILVIATGFLLFVLLQPICFVFEQDKLTIRYFFGFHEIVYWEKVKKTILYRSQSFVPFFSSTKYRFVVDGGTQGKKASFTASVINANQKTAKCIADFSPENFEIEDRT